MAAESSKMERFTFTVGKLDAGMAILIGERAHLIEFPSLLLPPGVQSGSIVNISVSRNIPAENAHLKEFWTLQDSILQEYGISSPSAPELKLRHVTQTSVTLEWPSLQLAKAKLRSLEIYKNGQRLALIPNPMNNTSTKLSSLQLNEEYTFQLILKTTAGTFPSNVIRVRTHTMNDTSGISVCFGNVEDPALLTHVKQCLDSMHAKWTEKIQIDTTHFVCTTSASPKVEEGKYSSNSTGPGVEYQKAMQLSLPVVQPQWIMACQGEKKVVPISSFQLGNTPPQTFSSAPFTRIASQPKSPTLNRGPSFASASNTGNAIGRAPSPETIARMSISTSSPSLARIPQPGVTSPTGPFPGASPNGTPVKSSKADVSSAPEAQKEEVQEVIRVKSPRPEAVGKLDRSFKFPVSPKPDEEPDLPEQNDAVEDKSTDPEKTPTATAAPVAEAPAEAAEEYSLDSVVIEDEAVTEPISKTEITMDDLDGEPKYSDAVVPAVVPLATSDDLSLSGEGKPAVNGTAPDAESLAQNSSHIAGEPEDETHATKSEHEEGLAHVPVEATAAVRDKQEELAEEVVDGTGNADIAE